MNNVPLHIWYRCSDYRHGITVMRLGRISFASSPSPSDLWPHVPAVSLPAFTPPNPASNNQSPDLFEVHSIFAKPGRDDVMMAIAYNAAASCRCRQPILSWGMTSAAGGVRGEHLPDDLVSRKQLWSGARRCATDASSCQSRRNV